INLGLVLTEIPNLGAAEQAFSQALQIFEKKFGRDYAGAQVALSDLGYVHMLQGRLDQAEQDFAEVDKNDAKRQVTDDIPLYYWSGELARLRGDLTGALRLDQKAVEAARKSFGENTRFAAVAHHDLALALRDSGDRVGAERELRAAMA